TGLEAGAAAVPGRRKRPRGCGDCARLREESKGGPVGKTAATGRPNLFPPALWKRSFADRLLVSFRRPKSATRDWAAVRTFERLRAMQTATVRSFCAKPGQVEQKWWLVDANGKVTGRLASDIAMILMGKHRPTYTPHVDTGDYV